MKKIISVAVMALGLGLAGSVSAGAFTGNTTVTADADGCIMLSGSVTLGVSSSVHGMWVCNEGLNLVKVGACHEGGSRKPYLCDVVSAATVEAPDATKWNYEGCVEIGKAPTGKEAVSYNAFVIGSDGGSVAPVPLTGARCSNDTISALTFFK